MPIYNNNSNNIYSLKITYIYIEYNTNNRLKSTPQEFVELYIL